MKRLKMTVPVILFSISATVSAQEMLPPPDPQMKGDIGLTYDQSEPPQYETPSGETANYPPLPQANAGKEGEDRKPNILIIMLDDVGFGQTSTFGGPAHTPNLQELADNGLSYNTFHTTALCAPTRAALLTGQNHHSAATGILPEDATGYPGYTGIIPRNTATIGEILKQNGYNTAWFGKHHNVPVNQRNVAGPFDRWPTGLGFEYFYGFLGSNTNQWYPILYENTRPVEPPKTPEEGYHLTTDLADKAITWVKYQQSIAPNKPFFVYFAPGAAHSPHQVPVRWRDQYQGKFHQGWDELRRKTFESQKNLGVIPPDTILTCYPHHSSSDDSSTCTPRIHKGVLSTSCHCPDEETMPPWEVLKDDNGNKTDSQKVAARFMENYAGFLEHTDHEIGRVIDAIRDIKEFDNTLIFYIVGDNGGAPNGKKLGTTNLTKVHNRYPEETIDNNLSKIKDIGTPASQPFYNTAWGWAGNAPFQWHKHVASHFGGTRNPLVISWPAKINPAKKPRSQFHHVIDIVPTILEVTGIEAPIKVNGIDQKPIEGVSMAYTFQKAKANESSARITQYFELDGSRAIYHKGWVAGVHHTKSTTPKTAFKEDFFNLQDEKWELYYTSRDFSQAIDLAENPKYQKQLNYLKDLLWAEMSRYNALPLDDRSRGHHSIHPGYTTDRQKFEFYPGAIRLSEFDAPDVKNRSYTITVDVDLSSFKEAKEVNGVLVAHSDFMGGYALYLQKGILKYTYNWFDEQQYIITSNLPVDPAKTTRIEFKFTYGKKGHLCAGAGGSGTLYIDGTKVGSGPIERTIPHTFGIDIFDIGVDLGAPVVKDVTYQDFARSSFAGLKKVTFELDTSKLTKLTIPKPCQWDD
jgi:arylsulfatase A-like enzyme